MLCLEGSPANAWRLLHESTRVNSQYANAQTYCLRKYTCFFQIIIYYLKNILQRHWYHPHVQTYLRNLDSCLESKAKWSYCASHRLADAFLRAWSPFRLIASFCYGTSVRLYPSNWISICMRSAPQNHGPAYTFGCVVLHRLGGGAKVGTGICTVIHLDLLLQVNWIACEPSWDLLCVGHSWGAHGTGLVRPIIQASPLTPYSQQMYKKNTIARMRPAILQWFQSILFFLASPAGAAAPRRSRGHVWPVTTSTRLKRSASVLPQMLGFNLGSGAFRDWSLGLPN